MTRRFGRALGVLAVLVTLGIWFALGRLEWPVRLLTTILLGPLPALTLLQAQLLDDLPPEAERQGVYLSSAVSIWVLAALAMAAARYGGFTRAELGIAMPPISVLLGAAGLTTLAGLAVMAAGRVLELPETALVDFLIPRTAPEKIAFAGLSFSAGIAEEVVFRSFLITALFLATESMPAAVSLSVAAFAVTHAYQGVSGVMRVAVLGLILTAPFLLTGSIYPGMIAHTALDLLAGLVLADWLRGADA